MNWVKRVHKWGNAHEWVLVLLLGVVVLRIPSLVTPHFYGDEEIYFVMGRAWREGVPLYRAMFDHKPPLIYILAGIFPTIATFRTMLVVMMLIHTVLFWKLVNLFWAGKSKIYAYLSSGLFVILSTLPTFEGLIVNAELLMMMPITLSLLIVWSGPIAWRRYLIAGLVAGVGWLYKIPVVFDFVAIALYLFVFREKTLKAGLMKMLSGSFFAFVGGFITPLLLTFVYYFLKGDGVDYLGTVLTMNLGYISSWSTSSYAFNPFQSGLLVRAMLLAVFVLSIYGLRKKLDKRLTLAALWCGWSLFGALLSFRPYPHYLQELVLAVSLLLPTLFTTRTIWGWSVWAMLIGGGIVTQQNVKFWGYPTLNVYRDFLEMTTGRISKIQYRERFDNTKRNYLIASYLNERLSPSDEIFVWGSDPTVYNLTRRLPTGGRYIVSFHVKDLGKYDYVMENLRENVPKAIVVIAENNEFAELELMIQSRYIEVLRTNDAVVYWRLQEI